MNSYGNLRSRPLKVHKAAASCAGQFLNKARFISIPPQEGTATPTFTETLTPTPTPTVTPTPTETIFLTSTPISLTPTPTTTTVVFNTAEVLTGTGFLYNNEEQDNIVLSLLLYNDEQDSIYLLQHSGEYNTVKATIYLYLNNQERGEIVYTSDRQNQQFGYRREGTLPADQPEVVLTFPALSSAEYDPEFEGTDFAYSSVININV